MVCSVNMDMILHLRRPLDEALVMIRPEFCFEKIGHTALALCLVSSVLGRHDGREDRLTLYVPLR